MCLIRQLDEYSDAMKKRERGKCGGGASNAQLTVTNSLNTISTNAYGPIPIESRSLSTREFGVARLIVSLQIRRAAVLHAHLDHSTHAVTSLGVRGTRPPALSLPCCRSAKDRKAGETVVELDCGVSGNARRFDRSLVGQTSHLELQDYTRSKLP